MWSVIIGGYMWGAFLSLIGLISRGIIDFMIHVRFFGSCSFKKKLFVEISSLLDRTRGAF